jgi:hypothetical protein
MVIDFPKTRSPNSALIVRLYGLCLEPSLHEQKSKPPTCFDLRSYNDLRFCLPIGECHDTVVKYGSHIWEMGMHNTSSRGFAAFVSYSHADKIAARKLHRRLESYRLPKNVAADVGEDGASVSRRLGPIFIDREDLPAAQDLSASVKAALELSQILLVLCSPNAKASPWVAREIELFRAIHPNRPVLAAVLDGGPEDAFPEPLLQGGEPLAADLRKEGDGPRLGFLKIVAGIANVTLDALVQRDAQRRLRRVMAITAGALAAMLAMAIMTFIAIQSRNEAQRQRAAAEGLVEFMFTDLREELKDRSTLKVMTKVNQRALDYYADQGNLAALPDDSLLRRTRIIHGMAEDEEKRGNLDLAQQRFTEAQRVSKSLLAKSPGNPNHVFVHGQSEYYLGYMAYLKDDWKSANQHWREYKRLSDQLVQKDSNNVKWLREAGYADGNMCSLALATKNSAGQLDYCKRALDRMEQVLRLQPGNADALGDVINRIGWMSDVYRQQGKNQQRAALLQRGTALVEGLLAKDPENNDLTDVWLTFQTGLMSMDMKQSPTQLKAALNAAEKLVKHDPSNRVWVQRLTELKKLK